MPQDLNCPKCEQVFAVTEARHPVGVQCPGCDAELTAEFRRVPVPTPGESPYELVVSEGRPAGSAAPATSAKKPLPLDDDDEEGNRRGGGSMAMVVMVGLTALVITLGGLGVTGYYLFTNLDVPETSSYSHQLLGSSNSGGNKSTTGQPRRHTAGGIPGGAPGGGWPGGGWRPVGPPPKKADGFSPNDPEASGHHAADARCLRTRVLTLPGKIGTMSVGVAPVHRHALPDQGLSVSMCRREDLRRWRRTPATSIARPGQSAFDVGTRRSAPRLLAPEPRQEVRREGALTFGAQMIGMGNRTNGPLMVVDPFGEVALLDLTSTDAPVIEGSQGRAGGHAGMSGGLRVTPNGKVFATFDGFNANSKVILLSESGRKWKATKDTYPIPFPNAAGDLFFGNGAAMDASGKLVNVGGIGLGSTDWFVPATSGNYFLKLATVTDKPGAFGKKTFTLTVHTDRNGSTPVAGIAAISKIETEGIIDV